MKNLDTIDVTQGSETFECGTVVDYISLVLNGETVKGTFDSFMFACSAALQRAKLEILTCSCGHAGCAGIWDGTDVKRRRYTVEWRDIDCGLPKRFYSFDAKAYDAAIEKTEQFMRSIAEKREAAGLNDDDHYDGIFGFWTVEEFEHRIKRTKERMLEWYSKD